MRGKGDNFFYCFVTGEREIADFKMGVRCSAGMRPRSALGIRHLDLVFISLIFRDFVRLFER